MNYDHNECELLQDRVKGGRVEPIIYLLFASRSIKRTRVMAKDNSTPVSSTVNR